MALAVRRHPRAIESTCVRADEPADRAADDAIEANEESASFSQLGLRKVIEEVSATRDIEAAVCDEHGRSLLSRTAVSQVTERLWSEYEAFTSRDLSEYEIAYLFSDGIAERLHRGQRREAVLCAWGITTEGQKVLLRPTPSGRSRRSTCTIGKRF